MFTCLLESGIPAFFTRRQRQHRDGDGGPCHVDRRPQRDRDRVGVLVQVQLLGQRHVHRNVGGRAAGEEGRYSN